MDSTWPGVHRLLLQVTPRSSLCPGGTSARWLDSPSLSGCATQGPTGDGKHWGSPALNTDTRQDQAAQVKCKHTLVQLFAFGSSSSTVVICFRKSDSCIPGWDPRRLNTAVGLDKMT